MKKIIFIESPSLKVNISTYFHIFPLLESLARNQDTYA
jgi:hypothetical protein